MDKLIQEVKTNFATHIDGLSQLKTLPDEYRAYTFRNGVEYGVAVQFETNSPIHEEASNTIFATRKFNGKTYIVLSCVDEEYRNTFANLCIQMVIPGEKGCNRKELITSPIEWWNSWTGLLGNRISNKASYDVIAEMLIIKHLFEKHASDVKWTTQHAGTHDIETNDISYEVKSTIKKKESKITISSQFQLQSKNPLKLIFVRMEESTSGKSINDLKIELIKLGYPENKLEAELSSRGYILGNHFRDSKFTILEAREYNINDTFPKITNESFKNNVFPQNIVQINYTIDLEGLDYNEIRL